MNFTKNAFCGLLLVLILSDTSSANVRICGKSLTQFLEMMCVDGFNSKNLKAKKSVPAIESTESDIGTEIQPLPYPPLFLNDLYANHNNLIAKTRRRRFDGVADECCNKPCAMSELLSYCL